MKINENAQKAIVGVLIVGAVFFAILYNPSSSSTQIKPPKSAVNVSLNVDEKIFTVDELSQYNGKNGTPAYVALDGVVYDVTNAEGWKDGVHKNGITAGKDLTNEISKSPHGKSVIKKLTTVGKLQ